MSEKRVLFYDSSGDRYHYARYDEESGFLELGSALLGGNHRSFHPQEKFRLLVAGSGDRVWSSRYYTTPTTTDLSRRFDNWFKAHKVHEQREL